MLTRITRPTTRKRRMRANSHPRLIRSILISYFCPSIQQKANEARFSSLQSILSRTFDQCFVVTFGPGIQLSLQSALGNAGALSSTLDSLASGDAFTRNLVVVGGADHD